MGSLATTRSAPSLWRRLERHRVGWAFILPVFVLFAVFRIWPAINGFLLSFQDYRLAGGTTYQGLRNYRDLFDDKVFWGALRVTLKYAVIAVPLTTVMSLAFALLINRAIRGITLYRAIYFLPYVTSLVMVSVIWSWVYRADGGLLNGVLTGIGLEPVKWLSSKQMVIPSLAIMAAWKGVGYSMMILLAGLKAIPETLTEASQVDGATGAQTFWRVTLPLLRPVLFFVLVIETIGAFQVFDTMYVMTNGGPVRASYSLVYMLYDESFKFMNFGYGAAIGMILFLITFVVMMLQRLMFGRSDT
ncbi:MAG TPA: sugar ABC transporter permease [Thermomicrobiales bacterium]|nr:sugar ABC transporter permease [Thermomicrobiales bacterium]